MTEQEIIDKSIVLSIEANKKLSKKVNDICLHDLYKHSVEMAENISYHAVKGVFPKKLFEHRSPNETKLESDYIEKNYKQLTLPVFIDYLSTIGRPLGDGNWGIDYKKDASEYSASDLTFQNYVEYKLPIYGSLENFVKFILPSIKSIDANAFIAIRPKEIPYVQNEFGEKLVDSNKLYEPTIHYFESKDVIDFEQSEYYLFLSKMKSDVEYGGKKQKVGNVYELYTDNAIYFIIQNGLKTDNSFNVEIFYQHDLKKCPVHQMMGIPQLVNDKILWQSPFLYSTDLLDLVTTNGNWEQAMINSCVFPVKVMFGSKCEFRDSYGNICQDGKLLHEGKESTCSSCNGQGLKSRISPLGTLLINPTTKFEQGEEKATQDPLKYISPDVTTLEFIHKKVESDTLKARSILHLRNKNTNVVTNDGTVTATEILDDSKGMYAFIKPISDQIFTIYEFCLNTIGRQRYGDKFEAPELSYPKTFDFKSAEDYLNDISNATANNLPPSFIQAALMQYINAYYGDNQNTNRIFKLVISADRLFGLSQDDINMKLARGTVSKWEDILHSSSLNFINDSILSDEKFIEKPIEEQVLILQDIAKMKQLEIEGKPLDLNAALLPTPLGAGGNALKESVGGLTGMIEIAKAVAAGLYDLDAAVALVQDRFNLTEEEARRQLGTPQQINSVEEADKIAKLT